MQKYNVVVTHPYKQHSFELAEGLRRCGYLYKYITTVYYKKYNLTYLLSNFINKKNRSKARLRSDNRIDKYVVQKTEFLGLMKLLIMKNRLLKKYYTQFKYYSADRFAIKTAKYVLKHNVDAVVVYDDTSYLLSKIIKEKNPKIKIILDMSAPSLLYLSKIYEKDMKIKPNYAEQLKQERSQALDNKLLERCKKEIEYADYFIVASKFTKKSLEYSKVDSKRIFICRYGVDFNKFQNSNNKGTESNNKLKVIFIGGTKEFKGISYLLDAYEKLNEKISLTIIGECNQEIKDKYDDIEFTGIISHEEVSSILKNSDLMIFPSLGDGFGLSITEALASGVPVICTSNTGASDIIKDGKNGYVVDAQNSNQIVEKTMILINNRDKLNQLKENSRNSIKEYTWDNYYNNIGKIFDDILK